MVGIQQNKAQLDGTCGLFVELENLMDRLERVNTFLLATADSTLLSAPYGYAQGDINILKSAFADAMQLVTLYRGTAALAVAKDFRTFSKLTIGTGL